MFEVSGESRGHRLRRPGSMPQAAPGLCPGPFGSRSFAQQPGGRLRQPPRRSAFTPTNRQGFALPKRQRVPPPCGHKPFACAGKPAMGAGARRFTSAGFASPFFSEFWLLLQKCLPVLPSLRRVSIKVVALRVLHHFYKPSLHILVMPVTHVFRARNSEKNGDARS